MDGRLVSSTFVKLITFYFHSVIVGVLILKGFNLCTGINLATVICNSYYFITITAAIKGVLFLYLFTVRNSKFYCYFYLY